MISPREQGDQLTLIQKPSSTNARSSTRKDPI